ncbi:heavy metal-binding protein HIP-like [Engraulis encrasicolus]|uniref:heavy metal-binding protein HIP-like n=1 Tax=Engraulis encrasicolus TaxID=184585 RepID=UPI002FD5F39B
MRAAILPLGLLLSICEVQPHSIQTGIQTEGQSTGAAAVEVSKQVDIYAELKKLKDIVEDLNVTLRQTQEDVKVLEADNTVMKTKLAVSEVEVTNLKKENGELKTRLETEITHLKMANTATVTEIEEQEQELTAVKTKLEGIETEVDHLQKEIKLAPKVAFSAGLTDSGEIQAGNTDLNLVFTKIITDVGHAYSSTTGFFTAPVRGVYYFRFTVMDRLHSRWMITYMCKNEQKKMGLSDYDTDGQHSYLSSGLTLELEVGDVVNMIIPAGHILFDSANNHSTFSGFLLFPL